MESLTLNHNLLQLCNLFNVNMRLEKIVRQAKQSVLIYIYLLETPKFFNVSIADFHKKDTVSKKKGILLENGNFIFWKGNNDIRRLVLTTNAGVLIKKGKVSLSATTWKDHTTWGKQQDGFFITNFVGMNGKNTKVVT